MNLTIILTLWHYNYQDVCVKGVVREADIVTVHGIIDQLARTVARTVTTGCAFHSNDWREQKYVE